MTHEQKVARLSAEIQRRANTAARHSQSVFGSAKEAGSAESAKEAEVRSEADLTGSAEFAGEAGRLRFQKSSVSHFVPQPERKEKGTADGQVDGGRVDVQQLDALLEIDVEKQICRAEPGLTFGKLLEATQRYGLMPACVPELEGITVGGAVSGCSVESMSYKYGGFHDRCLEYELVTGTGEVVRCSPERDRTLFDMVHGSYGTLGRLTEVTFALVEAKPFVQMDYVTFERFEPYRAFLNERCEKDDYDFVDGIAHGPDKLVACLGTLVDEAQWVSDYTGEQVYYRSTLERKRDYLTLAGYCFRYDTECHWLSRTVPVLEHPLVRRWVGRWFLGSTNLITWSKRLAPLLRLLGRPDVVVDVFVPKNRFKDFFDWYCDRFDFWPLWIVPYRMTRPYPWVAEKWRERLGTFVYDCAIYGKPNRDPAVDLSELLEQKVYALGGIKTLISRNHYDRKTFWQIYNRPLWQRVKQRTDPHNLFGELYAKMHPEA
jgi:FAD/FMN-containing dehydrogenase